MRLNWIVLLVAGAALAPAASLSLEGSVSNPGALVTARQLSQEALSQAQAGEGAKARDTMNEALSQAANDAVIIGNNANLLLLEGRFAARLPKLSAHPLRHSSASTYCRRGRRPSPVRTS